MRVTIWDLDYYYAKEKVNILNPDVMKISSYHKQRGDVVTFVENEFDIRRSFDLYYIIKEDDKTPNPPMDFFTNRKVRWWGRGFKGRINWKMEYAMMACRPDYLLYPEKNTALERAEYVRFFDDEGGLLPFLQDWHNTFKNKKIIVTDKFMWGGKKFDKQSRIEVLKVLQTMKNVMFLESILIQNIIYDKDIIDEFLKIKFSRGTIFSWSAVKIQDIDAAIEFMQALIKANPKVKIEPIVFDYTGQNKFEHWIDKEFAFKDFETIRNVICKGKKMNVPIKIIMPACRFNTPYFELFEELSRWTDRAFNMDWISYLSKIYSGKKNAAEWEDYWTHPRKWHEVYRDLLLQTYKYREFITHQMGDSYLSEVKVPWTLWEEEFKFNL